MTYILLKESAVLYEFLWSIQKNCEQQIPPSSEVNDNERWMSRLLCHVLAMCNTKLHGHGTYTQHWADPETIYYWNSHLMTGWEEGAGVMQMCGTEPETIYH